jgi:hypothetical protein
MTGSCAVILLVEGYVAIVGDKGNVGVVSGRMAPLAAAPGAIKS